MNIQALIKKYEEKYETVFGFPVIQLNQILEDLKQLDEPQKVTIPQFVADWLNENDLREETLGEQSVFDVFDSLKNDSKNGYYENVKLWIDENGDLFARAWLDGYEVEKEKRYLVKVEGVTDQTRTLKRNIDIETWYFGNPTNYEDVNAHHTRKELEYAGFCWVFDCPGVEVEEVEE